MSTGEPALLTDLYQLTMAHAYFELDMRETAVFELFVRRLPTVRGFLVAVGLEQVADYLEGLRFTPEEVAFLDGLGIFSRPFLQFLATLRFTGTVHAMAEGTPFFANEPILRVTAPILEAQLVESRIINIIHFQSMVASKAVRCVMAARGRRLIDFGMRRSHGAEAAVLAARASFVAGFDATATVEAGRRFGIPLSGTMAHSFIEAHDGEEQALRNFVTVQGCRTSLLIDTYDTARAAQRVAALADTLKRTHAPGGVQGVRIDSGDLGAQALAVRHILDARACQDVQIMLSGDLDEYRIESLMREGTPVDAFGVGTRLDVSEDAPSLDMAYKLESYAGQARRKRSPGKETWPGSKQVFRQCAADGQPCGDVIALTGETCSGEPLLRQIIRDGRRIAPSPNLTEVREFCRRSMAQLPASLRELRAAADAYPVQVSDELRALAASLDRAGE